METVALIYFGLLGIVAGSFANVIIYRLPQKLLCAPKAQLSIGSHRSFCPRCRHRLRYYDLIPVISWIMLLGQCRYCHHPITPRYAYIELISALLFMLISTTHFPIHQQYALMAISILLLCAIAIDADTYLLPDQLTQPLLWSGLITALFGFSPISVENSLYGAIGGYLLLWIPAKTFFWLKREHGLGGGDIKLVAGLGAWLGFEKLPGLLILACLAGLIFILLRHWIMTKQESYSTIVAFGPFLAISGWLALLGDPFIIGLFII